MREVSIDGDNLVVDAEVIARGFRIEPAEVPVLMREGRITSRSEIGQDEDEGRRRVTFYYSGRALRLVIDENGTIIRRATFDV